MFDAEAYALGWGKESWLIVEDLLNSEKPLKIVKFMTITESECKNISKSLKDDITIKHICVKAVTEGDNLYYVSRRSLFRSEEFLALQSWIKNTFISGRQWCASGSRRKTYSCSF